MVKKSAVEKIMDEGAEKVKEEFENNLNKIKQDIVKKEKVEIKKKSPSKIKISQKETQKIITETKKLTPGPIIKEQPKIIRPEINYVIEETIRYDINWIYLRKMLLDIFRLKKRNVNTTTELKTEIKKKRKSIYNLYEDWFNKTFNSKLIKEDNTDELEDLAVDELNGVSNEWQVVNDKDMDKLLADIPSLINKKPIEKTDLIFPTHNTQIKSGMDFINLIQNSNHSIDQTREFYIAEIKRLEDESNLMKYALLKTVLNNNETDVSLEGETNV